MCTPGALPPQLTALALAEAAPHAAKMIPPQRILEALLLHRAHRAHGFGLPCRLAAAREEIDPAEVVEAFRVVPPIGIDVGADARLEVLDFGARSHSRES